MKRKKAEEEARVVSVNVSAEKGTSKKPVAEIVIDGRGVSGDGHAGTPQRNVSLLAIESIERFAKEAGRKFQCGDFAENITTCGIDIPRAARLDRIRIGKVELEVTQVGKVCHGDGCAIFREVGQCVMPKEGIFARALRGGTVRAGDAITYVPKRLKCLVITLSDRAHQGVYADQSGPRAQALVEAHFAEGPWPADVETVLLPDDADRLGAALERARDTGVDVVFTTGGTGIGPRDITPDVVTGLADKIIPGIMEHIRVKFGAEKPNVLLSRSVAAVLGQTLVYTLPGSVRAVDEYLGEILKSLEHAVLMLHGLDAH